MRQIPPEHEHFFGRVPEVAALRDGASKKGLTILTGRPKTGKTWLTLAACEAMSREGWLVGYYEAGGGEECALLPAIEDLWRVACSRFRLSDKAWALAIRNSGKPTSVFIRAVEEVLGSAAAAFPPAGLVREVLRAIRLAERSIAAAGEPWPLGSIPYEFARDIISLVDVLLAKRCAGILIVLDAWEQSASPGREFGILRKFLGHFEDWPDSIHFLLVAREGQEPDAIGERIEELRATNSSACRVLQLPPLHLRDDANEADRLVRALRREVPAARLASAQWLVENTHENPAVLQAWFAAKPIAQEQLVALAKDAEAYKYREMSAALAKASKHDGEVFRMAAALGLLAEFTEQTQWLEFRAAVFPECSNRVLERMMDQGILEQLAPPSFGHRTRYEVAQAWVLGRQGSQRIVRDVCEDLVCRLSSKISPPDQWASTAAVHLAQLGPAAKALRLREDLTWLTDVARMMLDPDLLRQQPDEFFAQACVLADQGSPSGPMIAFVLVGAIRLNRWTKESRGNWLEHLQHLADREPGVLLLRQWLAEALHYCVRIEALQYYAQERAHRRDIGSELTPLRQLVEWLRDVSRPHPEDITLRYWLTMAVTYAFTVADAAEDAAWRDALLNERAELLSSDETGRAVASLVKMEWALARNLP